MPRSHSHHALLRMLGAAWIFIFTLLVTVTLAFASPYDAYGVRPGDVITNSVAVDYQNTDGLSLPPLQAQVSLTVTHLPPEGTIRAFEQFRGVGTMEQFRLVAGRYSQSGLASGSFVGMSAPDDSSVLSQGNAFSVPGTVALRETQVVRQGVPIVFVIEDETLNTNSSVVDTIVVELTDSVTNDMETIVFTETGPGTGVFSGWINTRGGLAAVGDGFLQTAQGSEVTAVYSDPLVARFVLSVSVMVIPPAPQGRVFDSVTGALLDGIRLTIVDDNGAPATVRSEDLLATFPSTVTTGQDIVDSLGRSVDVEPGEFLFPYLDAGTYRLVVEDDQTHEGPTDATNAELQALPGSPWALTPASRLGTFDVVMGSEIVFDVPLDPVLPNPTVVRNGSIDEGGVGDVFEYQVLITVPETGLITWRDELPLGVRFIPGTFRIDGNEVTPEVSEDGRTLYFRNIPATAYQPVELRYGARIGAEVDMRSWTILDTADYDRLSDDHDLEVVDVFGLQDTAILGEILAGPCGEPHQERNMGGIRVYLETGEYSITDEKGMFTFRGIERRPRVVQVDVNTLPIGAELVLCQSNTRAAGSAISRFVDVGPGQIARTDFRVVFDEEIVAAAEAASQALVDVPVEVAPLDKYTEEWFLNAQIDGPVLLAPTASSSFPSAAIEVVFIRHKDESPILFLDDVETRVSNRDKPVVKPGTPWVLERWRGVRIREGRTDFLLVMANGLGEELRRERMTVAYATGVGSMELDASGTVLDDDNMRPVVRLRMLDKNGVPVRAGTRIDLRVDDPYSFLSFPDRDSASGSERRPTQRLTTVVGPGGYVNAELAPFSGSGQIRISTMTPSGELAVNVPVEGRVRPWILVGLAEGTVASDVVRENLRPLTSDDNSFAGRIAFFAEGTIKGKWLLTVRYDSDHDKESFYGIDPDKDYIVYGDRSVQGNDAQSRFPLYVRLRSDEAEFLFGDFRLDIETLLIRETRKVSGLRALYETEDFKALAFVAETDQSLVRDRLPLNGSMGPYTLTQPDVVPNSETVTLLTVARNDATLELDSVVWTAGVDYTIDYQSGRIYLREPLSAFDEAFNRRVLLIDYETDSGDLRSRVAGVRVEGNVTEHLVAGATLLYGDNIGGENLRVTIAGIDIEYQVGVNSVIQAEVVRVRKEFSDGTYESGAEEVRYEYDDGVNRAYARLRNQRGDIEMTTARHNEEVLTAQAGISRRISGPEDEPELGTFVEGNVQIERNRTTGRRSESVEVLRLHRDVGHAYGGGLQFSRNRDEDGEVVEEVAGIAQGALVSEDGRFRQEIELRGVLSSTDDTARDTLSFGAEYDLTDAVTVFGRFDGSSPRGGGEMDRAFTFGLKARPWDGFDGILAISQANVPGASGFGVFASGTQGWSLSDTQTLSFGIDMQRDFGANGLPAASELGNPYIDEDFTAARIGYDWVEETWAMGIDAELRTAESGDTANLRIHADGEIGNGWTVGGEVFAGREESAGGVREDINVRFAAAQRRLGREPITLYQAEFDRSRGAVNRDELYLSVNHNRFVGEQGELGARYAVRVVDTDLSVGSFRGITHFGGLEYRHDLSERFDIGMQGSVMHDQGTSITHGSYGVSLGMTPFENGWVSLGYNFEGFHDDKFSSNGYTDKGPFIQFRLKFDQDTISRMFR